MNNILKTVKKLLGVPEDYDCFDSDILININMVLPMLMQIGISTNINTVTEESKWDDLSSSTEVVNFLRVYITLRVRMIFDPPTNSSLLDAMQKKIDELEWRLNLLGEEKNE
nr:MAG TPA: hypothetical protein [Caudoviricetes sp.]